MVENTRLAVLMTCHNRKKNTINCLEALKKQTVLGTTVTVFLVDDGSTDGTSAKVNVLFPDTILIAGNGDLYWCGGMRVAFAKAIENDYDFYLWLNDDTHLNDGALSKLFQTYNDAKVQFEQPLIIVGSTYDEQLQTMSYGGWQQCKGRLLTNSWEKVAPDLEHSTTCDTMNGNCVLISREVVERVDNLDIHFTHGMGDLDYGLRASKQGCHIVIAPGYYGSCSLNNQKGLWLDQTLPIWSRWKKLLGPKGLPIKEWMVFSRRHRGKLWFFAWLNTYVMFWLRAFTSLFRLKS